MSGTSLQVPEDVFLGEVVRSPAGFAVVDGLLKGRTSLSFLDPQPKPGTAFERTGRHWSTLPRATQLLGRVIDPLGRPLDGKPLNAERVRAPRMQSVVRSRNPHVPLWTGRKAIDLVLALQKGRSHLIAGPIALECSGILTDALANQDGTDVIPIFAALDGTSATLQRARTMLGPVAERAIFVHVPANAEPALRNLLAPIAVMLGEQIRANGGHALVAIDRLDLHEGQFLSVGQLLDRAGDVLFDESGEYGRSGSLTILCSADSSIANLRELIECTDRQTYLNSDGSVDLLRSAQQVPTFFVFRWNYKAFYSVELLHRWRAVGGDSGFGGKLPDWVDEWSLQRGTMLCEMTKQRVGERLSITQELTIALAVSSGFANRLTPDDFPLFERRVLEIASDYPEIARSFERRLYYDYRPELMPLFDRLAKEFGDPHAARRSRSVGSVHGGTKMP